MPAQPSSNILAVVYTDGLAADKFLASWVTRCAPPD
jgi:hypothetical protein